MAGGKETPRQKMIGMMYLVLTALLALNVSKQIISAFVILNDKIESGNTIIQQKNASTIDSYSIKIATLKAQKQLGEVEKIEIMKAKALAVDARIKGFCNYVIMEASEMIKQSEGKDWYIEDESISVDEGQEKWLKLEPLSGIAGMDNYDIPTNYFVGDAANPTGKGVDIIDSLIAVRDYVTKMMANYEHDGKKYSFEPPAIRPKFREDRNNGGSEYRKALRESLKTANPEDTLKIIQVFNLLTPEEMMVNHEEEVQWIVGSFDHAPIVAAAAFLTSIRADALQAESIAQDLMASKAEAPMFKFNKIEPLAFARTGYINQGDSLNVKAYIAAYDSTAEAKIRYWIDDSTMSEANMKEVSSKQGVSVKDVGIGTHTVFGQISVKERGQDTWKKWRFPFEVGKPSGSIGMPEMLTLYRGYPNVISASASGYPSSALSLSCSPGCNLSKQGDNWIATVASGKTAKMTLTAKKDGGGSASLATADFVVRAFPTPTPLLGGKEPGEALTKSGISANRKLILTLGDSPLKAQFSATSFELVIGTKIVKCTGAELSAEALNKLSTAPSGTAILLRKVQYTGSVPGKNISGGWTIQ
jgi:gliding motility-associated protein GldM